MPSFAASTPGDSARVMRRLRNAASYGDFCSLVRTAPLPVGCKLTLKNRFSTTSDQDRLDLSSQYAIRYQRVWGIVSSLRKEKFSANTTTPASAQVVLRIVWLGVDDDLYRSFFVRTTLFAAAYTPRFPSGNPCSVSLGDIVSGTLGRPSSDRNSSAFACWDFGRLDEWRQFAPYSMFHFTHFNADPVDTF